MNKIKAQMDLNLKDISMSSALKENILNSTVNQEKAKRYTFSAKKVIFIAAAIILVFSVTTTAFASVNPAVNNMIYSVNPELAQFLYPVNKSSEDKGLKLTVLSAVNDNRNVVVYFTIEDTQEKGRVNERLDLCDAYGVNGPTAYHVEFISYDDKTGKALFCMTGNGTEKVSGRMNSFKISKMMSNKKKYDYYNTGFDLTSALLTPKTDALSDYETDSDRRFETILMPDEMHLSIGEDFVSISNIGFIDGKLHIQTKWEPSFDNHGLLVLHEKGKAFSEENAVSYTMQYIHTREDIRQSGNDVFAKHVEYVFDISPEDLSNYDLWAELYEDGEITEGKWKVDFRLERSDELKLTDNLKDIADKVEISNIGVYVDGYQGELDKCNMLIELNDGSVFDISHFSNNNSENILNTKWKMSTEFPAYIDIHEICSVSIDGKVIYDK